WLVRTLRKTTQHWRGQKNGRRFGISHAVYQKSGEVVGKFTWNAKKVCEGELTKGHIPQACRGARIYKIRQRGFPVLRSVSHKRQPPRNALRLSPRFTPRGNCFILFTLPPPRTTVSATKESFSWVRQ